MFCLAVFDVAGMMTFPLKRVEQQRRNQTLPIFVCLQLLYIFTFQFIMKKSMVIFNGINGANHVMHTHI